MCAAELASNIRNVFSYVAYDVQPWMSFETFRPSRCDVRWTTGDPSFRFDIQTNCSHDVISPATAPSEKYVNTTTSRTEKWKLRNIETREEKSQRSTRGYESLSFSGTSQSWSLKRHMGTRESDRMARWPRAKWLARVAHNREIPYLWRSVIIRTSCNSCRCCR